MRNTHVNVHVHACVYTCMHVHVAVEYFLYYDMPCMRYIYIHVYTCSGVSCD